MVLVPSHWSSACKAFVTAIDERHRPRIPVRSHREEKPSAAPRPSPRKDVKVGVISPTSKAKDKETPPRPKKMDQVEALVDNIQALSGSTEDLAKLHTELKVAEELLQRNSVGLSASLAVLDAETHSLGYLYILDAQSKSADVPKDIFIQAVRAFLPKCSPEQVRLAPGKFAEVCRAFKQGCMDAGQPGLAAHPLRTAIAKIQPSKDFLTPQHADFLQACLLAKLYKPAADLLMKDDIFEADPTATGIVPSDFLLYCYYGALILIGVKEYTKAMELLMHAITAPALSLSAITVAAYKKFVVVSLIANGSVLGFPRYTSAVVQRQLKNLCQEYSELASSYKKNNITDFQKCVQQYSAVLTTDGNLGLVKQCIESLYMRSIQRLTQTYLTLSLQDIATAIGLPSSKDAERRILRMINAREIHATISQKDGMVSFMEDPEQYNTTSTLGLIDDQIHKMMTLHNKVALFDEQVSTSRTYISKVMMKERHGRFGGVDDFEMSIEH